MVCSLVNLTLWWASTQVAQRYSTQFTQNPAASVLSSQVIQTYSQADETSIRGWWSLECRRSNMYVKIVQPVTKRSLTWAVLFTVLLGASNESFTNTFSITSASMHSCLHTGQRITFTGTKQNHTLLNIRNTGCICNWTKDIYDQNQPMCVNTATMIVLQIDSCSLFVNVVTHMVWSPRQLGNLVPRSCPNSLRVQASISCKKSADTVEVWARDCRSSDSKRRTCPGNLDRSFLALACSQLRSLGWWQQHPPPSPTVLRVHPFAALLSFSAIKPSA